MSSRIRAAWAVFVLAAAVALVIGCGDYFRPTINFLPSPSGTPSTVANAVVLATNPSGLGSDTHIDVGGDSAVGIINVGSNPLFLGKGGTDASQAFVINSDNTVSLYIALFAQAGATSPILPTPTQIALPPSTSGPIAGAGSQNGNIYIAEQGPCVTVPPSPNGCVSVIPVGVVAQSPASTVVVPAGLQPVMVATNSVAGSKAYVINRGSNSVTVIGTSDNSVIKQSIPVGNQPIWGVMSNDGVDVFVVNQGDGTLSVIDTTLDIVFTTINLDGAGINPGLDSNFAFYDTVRKRVYVSNPGDNSVTVIKADSISLGVTPQILPTFLAKVQLSGSPISVGAISDGTRAYAALGNCPAGTNHTNILTNATSCSGNTVAVIDALALTQTKTITVGVGPVSLAVSSDGTKVYTANAVDQNMSIIKTSTDSEVARMAAPQQSQGCLSPNCGVTGVQMPFMVVSFP